MTQTVSIVIPHYGDPGPTQRLISLLLAQESSQVEQIIVCDDASPDPFPETDGVEVVRRSHNGGFGSAVNSGVKAPARGGLLLILNSDLEVQADFVAQLLGAAAKFPGAVLSPNVVSPAGTREWVGRDFPRIRHHATEWLTPLARWRHTRAWHRAVGHHVVTSDGDASVDWVVGAAMLIPAATFKSVGGFDERFFMNSEEVDLQRRLRALGVPSIALAAPTVIHAGGGSSPSAVRRGWVVDSRLAYADKWGSRRALQAVLVACTGVNLIVNAARKVAGRDVAPLSTARDEIALLRGR